VKGVVKSEPNVTAFTITVKNFGPVPALHVGVDIERLGANIFEQQIASICRKA
jgi:hypothetical protein